ncbi:hypothetical protein FQA39_LY09398 [Lamprigera yunnana]|nr:hypothetical protein FQA39_LY09398 [Lamprigera yunnana]
MFLRNSYLQSEDEANAFDFMYDHVVKFSNDFLFGVSTSAYQIEGAWNESGKGESIWDSFTHKRSHLITNNDNGDVSCDSYHKYEEDVELLKNIGIKFYRFSFSWSRILPKGFAYKINEDGIRYYNHLINLLVESGIQPMGTIFNWDTPLIIEQLGGFSNELVIDWFEDYAKVLFNSFGDRVKLWITINEPQRLCLNGYGGYTTAPGINGSYLASYACGHNVLKAHARVYHLYNKFYKKTQNGKISIALENNWYEPATKSEKDIRATEEKRNLMFFWFAHPLYANGDYPDTLKTIVAKQSKEDGFKRSQLPKFTDKEMTYINETFDFYAMTYYTNNIVSFKHNNYTVQTNDHLEVLLNTIHTDKVNVIGYSIWSLFDNFDWNNGYSNKFGLYHVNFTDSNRKRTPKMSVKFYTNVIKHRSLSRSGSKETSLGMFAFTFLPYVWSIMYG